MVTVHAGLGPAAAALLVLVVDQLGLDSSPLVRHAP